MHRTKAMVTPLMMKWARERARLDVETAAKKIGRQAEEIQQWEDGTLQPTMAQARKASEVYKRSLAVFYLPAPPKDFDTLQDFRLFPAGETGDYTPELALLIRRMQARQEWIREHLLSEQREKLPFVGMATIRTPEDEVARSVRETLSISIQEQIQCKTTRDALNLWIDKAEQAGIFVCREGGVAAEEARGLLLADDFAPFVFINSKDSISARLFTLVHELVHLWINQPGLSNLRESARRIKGATAEIESYCNRTAARTLVDEAEFSRLWRTRDQSADSDEQIRVIADHFKVSELVIARRLLDRGTLRLGEYLELQSRYRERWFQHAEREKQRRKDTPGAPSFYLLKLHANGRSFTQTVLAATSTGAVMLRDACALLGVKVGRLSKLAKEAGINLPAVGGGT